MLHNFGCSYCNKYSNYWKFLVIETTWIEHVQRLLFLMKLSVVVQMCGMGNERKIHKRTAHIKRLKGYQDQTSFVIKTSLWWKCWNHWPWKCWKITFVWVKKGRYGIHTVGMNVKLTLNELLPDIIVSGKFGFVNKRKILSLKDFSWFLTFNLFWHSKS